MKIIKNIRVSSYFKLMRLHQRTGVWLLLWPCWWSIALASEDILGNVKLFLLFAAGAVVMRGAGCVINDLWDRDIDRKVSRTKNRPLASGEITPKQAIAFLLFLLLTGLLILIQLNSLTILLGFIFMIPVVVYPLMKRVLSVPQLILGLTFNAGAVMGWSAVQGAVPPAAWLLYLGCICWTLGYDTIYAHQDAKDDERIGTKSSALSWGKAGTRRNVTVLYVLMIILFAASGTKAGLGTTFYVWLVPALAHLIWQIRTVDLSNPSDCMKKFRSNSVTGWLVFLGIFIHKFQ